MRAGIKLLLILCYFNSFAQNATYNTVNGGSQPAPPTFLRDIFSTAFEQKMYSDIQGSAFLDEAWLLARIKVEGHKVIESLPIRLNIYSHKIHFRNENGEEMQMALRVEEIRIIDSTHIRMNSVFLSNFDQERGFFELLQDGGKLKLLKKHSVVKWETMPFGSEVQRKFEPQGDLYFCSDKILYNANKSCSAIRDAFHNNQKVLDFISENKIKCNKEDDMRRLVEFYTSLK